MNKQQTNKPFRKFWKKNKGNFQNKNLEPKVEYYFDPQTRKWGKRILNNPEEN
jgi:hypothetical protein